MGLTACTPAVDPVPFPPERPRNLVAAQAPLGQVPPRSPDSMALEAHYTRLEESLVGQGLLRRDGGGPDVPFYKRNLVENFIRIAMFDEYSANGNRMVAKEKASRLRRWERPVRMSMEFGATIPQAQRSQDSAAVRRYANRLSRVTGLPITVTRSNPNFHILVVNEDDRRALGPRLRQIVPGISDTAVRTITAMPRSTLCLVFAFSDQADSSYSKAIAVIRGEHPDLMRLSCYHEELAQGLGLANDSAMARPSIFNDDEEFGLLTNHDELLLEMLYDRRLKSGMTATQARPIVEEIATELLGEHS